MLAFTPMKRRLAFPIASLLLLIAAAPFCAAPAAADERVPMIGSQDLPELGTLAPIERQDVTHVRVGKRDDIRWFAVTGVNGIVDYKGLVAVLKQRAGTRRPSTHGVWLTASAGHAWAHVLVLVKACFEAGIYRVGVRARSETTGRALGFPLFLPAGPSGIPGVKAGRLTLRLDALHPKEVKGASDIGHVYAAARRAVERRGEFGVDKVLGKIWISPNAPLQYALSTIDLLYRGGCAGVQVQMSMKASWRGLDVVPVVEIQGGVAARTPQALKPPRIQPRATPWGIHGANEAGWVDFQVTDLPAIDTSGKKGTKRSPPRPNYAASRAGVPPAIARSVDEIIRTWGHDFGLDLNEMVRQPAGLSPAVQKRFSVALRRKEVLPQIVRPARKAFPDATGVFPSTLQLHAYLFHQGKIQGKADVTIALTGSQVEVVFGTWEPLDSSAAVTLVPFGVDPFAAGDASAFRVWFESQFHKHRAPGAAWPLAPEAEVLRFLPAVAHPGTQRALAGRAAGLAALDRALQSTPYDRVALLPQMGTAAVTGANRRVIGTLTLRFEPQEGELRINGLTARRAP